jgi:2-haloacid dehalogenase
MQQHRPDPVSTYVFDAYGTLLDVHSATARHTTRLGETAAAFSQTWRTKQLEYSWVSSLMQRYRDFWALTEDALDFAMARHGITDRALRADLLAAYETLDAYPEVRPTLAALRTRGCRTALLSNGSPTMLARAVQAAGLGELLDATLSVDELRIYKPDPRVYGLVGRHLGVANDAVSFQSSNAWDIAGADAFGFRTVWVNRTNQPGEYRPQGPFRVVTDLGALLTPAAAS